MGICKVLVGSMPDRLRSSDDIMSLAKDCQFNDEEISKDAIKDVFVDAIDFDKLADLINLFGSNR